MAKKLLDFQASISDVEQINPLFSTCKVRVLYTGLNRNMTIITKDAVEKALPTLKNIPIVGEFSIENEDYKGHGGAIDLDSYKYIHTTKPYGVVPESATYEWEEVRGKEYLTISGCYLWTGRYEEAYSVIEGGKGQSMEIEVTHGEWVEEDDAYRIDNFIFSALCILGDDFEPAFEEASITAYSLDRDSFRQEFSVMLSELKSTLSNEKEEDTMLKELLEKYSLTVEELTEKGINFDEISEDELEAKVIEAFEIEVEAEEVESETEADTETDTEVEEVETEVEDEVEEDDSEDEETEKDDESVEEDVEEDIAEEVEEKVDFGAQIKELKEELATANSSLVDANKTISDLQDEVGSLREFKLDVEKLNHEAKAKEMFNNFQLGEADVEDLDIHKFSLEEIEKECYAILGKKLASKKNFSKSKDEGIRINIDNSREDEATPYGGLIEKYKNK